MGAYTGFPPSRRGGFPGKAAAEDPFAFLASAGAPKGRGNLDDFLGGAYRGYGSSASSRIGRPPTAGTAATARQATETAILAGTSVVIRGLAKAPEHNGKTGTVLQFDQARARYDIDVQGVGKLSLRPQSLTQRCRVEIGGLESKPELNGRIGEVFGYNEDSGRYTVMVQSPPTVLALQRGNCRLGEGTRVLVCELSVERYNGQMAQIVGIDLASGRYRLQCHNGEEIKVRFDKVVC